MSEPTARQLREAIESLDIAVGRDIAEGLLVATCRGATFPLIRVDDTGKWFHFGTQTEMTLAEHIVAIGWSVMSDGGES